MALDELPDSVEKMSVEAEQIGDKVIKVSFTEYVGRRKKTTRIEVKQSELGKRDGHENMHFFLMNVEKKGIQKF